MPFARVLSSVQKPVWMDYSLTPDRPTYNIGGYVSIKGRVVYSVFQRAFNIVVQENDALRLTFNSTEGVPSQTFHDFITPRVENVDLSASGEQGALTWMNAHFEIPLNPEVSSFHFALIKVAESHYFWCIKLHHLIADGWSVALLIQRVSEAYECLLNGRIYSSRNFTYQQYIEDDLDYLKSTDFQIDKKFWSDKLKDLPEPLNMNEINGVSFEKSGRSLRKSVRLNRSLYNEILEVANQEGVSVLHFFMAGAAVYFSRISGKSDLILGIPVLNRSRAIHKQTLGLFINLAPVRTVVSGTFREMLNQMKLATREALRHQKYPMDQLYADLSLHEKEIQHLFEITVSYEKHDFSTRFNGFETESVTLSNNHEKTPLAISIKEYTDDKEVSLQFDFNLSSWNADLAELFVHRFKFLIDQLKKPEVAISTLELIPPSEKERIKTFSYSPEEFPSNQTLVSLFDEQVKHRANDIAVVDDGKRYSYRELNNRANQLAHRLIDKGIGQNDIVAVCAERSAQLVISLLAILKTGATYLPIDSAYPEDRIHFMLQHSRADVLLGTADKINHSVKHYINLTDTELFSSDKINSPERSVKPDEVAYVIYTSGTTGNPNGVMVQHSAIVNLCFWHRKNFKVDQNSRATLYAGVGFDASAWEIWPYLTCGAALFPVEGETRLDLDSLTRFYEENKITHAFLPTRMCELLEEHLKKPLEILILTGGEELCKQNFNHLNVVNNYGPTEAAVVTTSFSPSEKNLFHKMPIGEPISNAKVCILDEQGKNCPIGVIGEIFIGGAGLAKGYLNNEQLSAERFVERNNPGEKFYKTGDLGRWLPDGNIAFCGRNDEQIKINGHRIELGEIESVLLQIPSIEQAAVFPVENEGQINHLVAYFAGPESISVTKIKRHLQQQLPAYMVPTFFVQMANIPLNANGKIDKSALPIPEKDLTSADSDVYSSSEEQIAQIWQNLLGVSVVHRNDNFFRLGGNSLLAARLQSRLSGLLNKKCKLSAVFENPTLAGLAEYIDSEETASEKIPATSLKDHFPLSGNQRRLWALSLAEQASHAYNMLGAFMLKGKLDRKKFTEALNHVFNRHESLRTVFLVIDGEPRQVIKESFEELWLVEEEIKAADYNVYIEKEGSRVFNLEKGPLVRFSLLTTGVHEHLLIVNMHHIIGDGNSVSQIFQEVSTHYAQLCKGEIPSWSPLSLQYKDYSCWLETRDFSADEKFWLEQFEEEPTILKLPTTLKRPAEKTYRGAVIDIPFKEFLPEKVESFSKTNDQTPFVTLLSALNALLFRYSGQQDIIIGTVTEGRERPELHHQVGFYANTLVLRNRVDGNLSFVALNEQVKSNTLKALEHAEYPFDQLVAGLNQAIARDRNPLFDLMVTMDEASICSSFERLPGIVTEVFPVPAVSSKFDLRVHINWYSPFSIQIEYNTDVFLEREINQLGQHFGKLLEEALRNPDQPIAKIELLEQTEKNRLIEEFNNTVKPYPAEETLKNLFEKATEKYADHIALVSDTTTLTYRQLNERSNQLAHQLLKSGIKKGDFVGIISDRNTDMVESVLAVIKCGAAYVPFEPYFPAARIETALNSLHISCVISQQHHANLIYSLRVENLANVIFTDEQETEHSKLRIYNRNDISHQAHTNLIIQTSAEDIAYVIYTSGSTGIPKGVFVKHRPVINLIEWVNQTYLIGAKDQLLFVTSLCFDLSVYDIFGILSSGGSLRIASHDEVKRPERLLEILHEEPITFWDSAPAALQQLLPFMEQHEAEGKQHLRLVFLSGDWVPLNMPEKLKEHFSGVKVVVLGGATEATVWSNYFEVEKIEPNWLSIPYGKPIQNARYYILNEQLLPQPFGVAGDLYIGGECLAEGYINDEILTCSKFLNDPFSTTSGARIYKTGDLARWWPEGIMEFLGRQDQQVKIRGYRIELGEIEHHLSLFNEIKEVIVVPGEDRSKSKYLVAYYLSESLIEPAVLREYLALKLPEYMIPSYFIRLDEIPVTANGKLNRKALPDPETLGWQQQSEQITEPRDAKEELILEVWKSILTRQVISTNDNFFTIGGDSIKAIQVVSRLHKAGYNAYMREIFQFPTIQALAARLKNNELEIAQSPVTGIIPLGPAQEYFFSENFRNPNHFNQAIRFKMKGKFEKSFYENSLNEIIGHHDQLRAYFSVDDNSIKQTIDDKPVHVPVQEIAVAGEKEVISCIERLQSSLSIVSAPLVKAVVFRKDNHDELFVVIHHLLVDAYSWRIIAEDFSTLIRQHIGNQPLQLAGKTTSYGKWAKVISAVPVENDLSYWNTQVTRIQRNIPYDKTGGQNRVGGMAKTSILLDQKNTDRLLTDAHIPYRTEITDILLAALSLAAEEIWNIEQLPVLLEGHGREENQFVSNISRTVGWFTSIYPLVIPAAKGNTLALHIRKTKDNLRLKPENSQGFSVLKYQKRLLAEYVHPQICFNYLGQLDKDVDQPYFSISLENTGMPSAIENGRTAEWDILANVKNGQLQVEFQYASELYETNTAEQFAGSFKKSLEKVLDHCVNNSDSIPSPGDFAFKQLSIQQLERIENWKEIKDMYPLSPMQQGMLFHSLMDPHSNAYYESVSYRFNKALNPEILQQAFNILFERYDILRTAFITEFGNMPLQVVYSKRKIEFVCADISHLDSPAQADYVQKVKTADKERGFHLTHDSLMRINLIQLGTIAYEFIWSHHHIIMDGWCLSVLTEELFKIYNSLYKGVDLSLPEVYSYKTYINWLENQDRNGSRTYWKNYLDRFTVKTGLPQKAGNGDTGFVNKGITRTICAADFSALNQIAAGNGVTISTLTQAIWGVLLSRYNNADDVVAGSVVSGRPAGLEGVERMIGLFINTVPVRIRTNPNTSFTGLLKIVQEEALQSEPHHYYPLAEIQAESSLKNNLLDHILVFENFPVSEELKKQHKNSDELSIDIQAIEVFEQTNYDCNITFIPSLDLKIRVDFNQNIYAEESIEKVLHHFETLVQQVIVNPLVKVNALELLDKEEQKKVTTDFNRQLNQLQADHYFFTVLKDFDLQHSFGEKTFQLQNGLGQIVPQGVKGELCMLEDNGQVLKTGEYFIFNGDGIRYMGGAEGVVRINGKRFQLSDVEKELKKVNEIDELALLSRKNRDDHDYIIAFVTSANTNVPTLRECIKSSVSGFMIPEKIVKLAQFPRTASGELDYHQLLAMDETIEDRTIAAVFSPLEQKLKVIWEEILGVNVNYPTDNFFDLGGHSLKVVRLASRIHAELNVKIRISEVFENATIKELSGIINATERSTYQAIGKLPNQPLYALSHAQKRQWLLSRIEETATVFNIYGSYQFDEEVDQAKMEQALEGLIRRHESLRTVFVEIEGEPYQKILSPEESGFLLAWYDLTGTGDAEDRLKELAEKQASSVFDLAHGPLFKASLVKLKENSAVLLVNLHHIISDGWSTDILIRDLLNYYSGNNGSGLPELKIQYRDFAAWHNKLLNSSSIQNQKKFWQQKLAADLPFTRLPADFERPEHRSYKGAMLTLELNSSIQRGLHFIADSERISVFDVMWSVFSVWLHKTNGENKLLVGAPFAARDHDEIKDLVGLFINPLPIITGLNAEESFNSLAKRVHREMLEIQDNQQYPLDMIINDLGAKRENNKSALFEIVFNWLVADEKPEETNVVHAVARQDFMLTGLEHNQGITLYAEYSTELFREETINFLLGNLLHLIDQVVENPAIKIYELTEKLDHTASAVDDLNMDFNF